MTQSTRYHRLIPTFVLGLVLFLSGCATGYGPPVNQAQLEDAHRSASNSLELARSLNAPDYAPELYDQAQSLFQKTFKKLKESPTPQLTNDYESVVERARESALVAAQEQVTEIEALRKTNDELRSSLKTKDRKLRRARKRATDRSDSITRLKSRLTRLQNTLRTQNEMRQRIARLKEKLSRARDRSARQAVMIRFDTAPLFEAGSADFTPAGQRMIDSVVPILKEHDRRMIQVRGHTDALPVAEDAPFESNWELSAKRAINVVKYLVYARDIEKDRVMAIGMAGYHPRGPNNTERQRDHNRRVEILLQPPDSQIAVEDQSVLSPDYR